MSDVTREPDAEKGVRPPDPALKKIIDRTKELAYYCYSCGKCLVVCPTSLLKIFSPKGFIHEFTTTFEEDPEKFIRTHELFNCLTCEQCAVYCPMASDEKGEGVLIAEIVRGIREYSYKQGLLDDQLAACSTHDNIMEIFPSKQVHKGTVTGSADFIINDKDLRVKDKGEIAFFVGCMDILQNIFYDMDVDYRLSAKSVVRILNDAGIEPVVLNTKCCGHDAYWSGDTDTARGLAEFNVALMREAGVKKIIVNCAEGYRMWKFDYPELVEDFDFEVYHFSEFLVKEDLLRTLVPMFPVRVKVTYHDPCRLGRLGGNVFDAPRKVLESIPGVELIEMENNRENANCCGVPLFRGCNSDTRQLRAMRIKEAISTGAEYLITTCPKCITHFACYMNEPDDFGNPKDDSERIKVTDLATFIATVTQKL